MVEAESLESGGDAITPESVDGVREALANALEHKTPLELLGRGTKRSIGRPSNAEETLDLSKLTGISLYEPEELILSAATGTTVKEIEDTVGAKGQIMAFEPPDLGPLLGAPKESGTLGGLLACNLAGPRRIKSGAARDHFLGVSCVSGRGEIFKAGGRVMKNVSGYDMMKILAGSYGTLAAMTSATIKVLPRPEKTYTVLLYGLAEKEAVAALTQGLCSAHELSAAAHLPAALAARSGVSHVSEPGRAVTALRIEGPGPSVLHRTEALRRELAAFGDSEELHSQNSLAFWREVRDVTALQGDFDRLIWKISVAPSETPAFLARLGGTIPEMEAQLDWGGGLIWLSIPTREDAWAPVVRGALPQIGGHATLLRAPRALRITAEVFQPQSKSMAALSKRVKESFDPMGLLNPGRMTANF